MSDPSFLQGPVLDGKVKAGQNVSYHSMGDLIQHPEEISALTAGAADPLRGFVRKEENLRPAEREQLAHALDPEKRQNVVSLSGQADPVFAKKGFAVGDRVYHKKRKSEGTILDLSAQGKAHVHLDNGTTGWMTQDNLVTL